MAWKEDYLDAILVPTSFLVLLGYHFFLYLRVRSRPLSTVIGVNHYSRKAWVISIMKDNDKRNILAVQSLRNGIMASTFLASTSILLCSFVAAFIASNNSFRQNVNEFVVGSTMNAVVTWKFFCLIVCFFFAFMCHIQAIRYSNHVNFLINIPSADFPAITPDYVASVLAAGSNFYTIGTRGLYFAFPLLLWLFGPIPAAVSSMIMVPVLYGLDFVKEFNPGDASKKKDREMETGRLVTVSEEDRNAGHLCEE